MNFTSIIAAFVGAGISQSLIFDYFERKRARTEIVMVRDRAGRFVDRAKPFERKMVYGYIAIVLSLAVAGNVILMA